jgi:hypothetical protein
MHSSDGHLYHSSQGEEVCTCVCPMCEDKDGCVCPDCTAAFHYHGERPEKRAAPMTEAAGLARVVYWTSIGDPGRAARAPSAESAAGWEAVVTALMELLS